MKTNQVSVWGIGLLLVGAIVLTGCNESGISKRQANLVAEGETMTNNESGESGVEKVIKTEEEWKTCLTPEQYRILREKGTERAFTGKFYNHKEDGTYLCAGCGNQLFESDTKYDSGSGWPSYYAPVSEENVALHDDSSLMMKRTEVTCSRCGAHLGHVFDDGPQPTGLRYCINLQALSFEAEEK